MLDFANPNYTEVLIKRANKLKLLRRDPRLMEAAKIHYKHHPWDFMNDWGMTFDPRNIERDLPPTMPFVLFPKQIEFVKWLHDRWLNGERGLVEKSRDAGATWLTCGYAVTMFLFYPGFTAGFGSRKEALVDKKGDPKCIFEKIRPFINLLPKEFKPKGFDHKVHSKFMQMENPENGASITGEVGDDIGRGARMSLYVVDEAAFIRNQESTDAALSQTTNCQIDLSTPNGNGNLFYKKRHKGRIPVFTMRWTDDPRKDQVWYDKQVREQDEVTVAQEIDIDYNASVEGIFIPSKWVQASLDAHKVLGFDAEGIDVVSFDPADVGDARAVGHRRGSVVLEAKSKKDGDITDAMPWAFELANDVKCDAFIYDADGMGAPSMKLYLKTASQGKKMNIIPYHGGAGVYEPDELYKEDKTNKDRFANRRAQTWMLVRDRFEKTYQAVVKRKFTDPSELISISSDCAEHEDLMSELSRPLRQYDGTGKIKVESKQDMAKRGVSSPNLADEMIYSFDPEAVPDVDDWGTINYPDQSGIV